MISSILTFSAKGHGNILSTHRNTVEFTHDKELTVRGDCILGVNATYSIIKIQNAHIHGKIKILMAVDGIFDEIIAEYNPLFEDPYEMVIRKTDFKDRRTFAVKANKAAKDIKRELVERMKYPDAVMEICISSFL